MNTKIISKARKQGLLQEYDLTSAKVGDKVLGLDPGEVIAIYGDTVVFGWQRGDFKSVTGFQRTDRVSIYLAPLCWVEEKPVYEGAILYKWSGKPVMAQKLSASGTRLLFSCGGWWAIYGSGSKLSWEPPQEEVYEVEGKPLKVGDVVFSRDGDEVTVRAFEMGRVITTPGRVIGSTQWTTDYLSWNDPTILTMVEGKPVRKGDVLYGTWCGNRHSGYEITGKDVDGRPMWCDVVVLTESLDHLTWTKPKAPPLNINGHIVPAPEREPLPEYTEYFVPCLFDGKADNYEWVGDNVDNRFLNSGLIHLTEEAATAHSQALISLTKS